MVVRIVRQTKQGARRWDVWPEEWPAGTRKQETAQDGKCLFAAMAVIEQRGVREAERVQDDVLSEVEGQQKRGWGGHAANTGGYSNGYGRVR